MEALVQIATHTPAWVFVVFVYGLFMGIRSMSERTVRLWAISVVGLVFLGLSLTSLIASIRTVGLGAPVWAAAVVVGLLAGSTLLSARIVDQKAGGGQVRIAGSAVTLVLFVLIFATKYYYNIRIALDHSAAADVAFVSTILALSGISTGIMLGRVSRLFAGYFGLRRLGVAP